MAAKISREHDLTPVQLRVLDVLVEGVRGRKRALTPAEVSKAASLHHGPAIIDSLAKLSMGGYVAVSSGPSGQMIDIRPTAKGRNLLS